MSEEKHAAVLHWLENFKATMPEAFQLTILGYCKLEDVLRYLHFSDFYSHLWGQEHSQRIEHTIERIATNYLISFPEITPHVAAELALAEWLKQNKHKVVYRVGILYHPFTIHYFIQYLQRHPVIYTWNASEVLKYKKKFEVVSERVELGKMYHTH